MGTHSVNKSELEFFTDVVFTFYGSFKVLAVGIRCVTYGDRCPEHNGVVAGRGAQMATKERYGREAARHAGEADQCHQPAPSWIPHHGAVLCESVTSEGAPADWCLASVPAAHDGDVQPL